jgi:hypothetical protein
MRVAAVLLIAGVMFSLALVARTHDINATDRHQCALILRLNSVILDTLERSRKGLPSNPYYRRHPRETAAQLRELDRTIRRFKQINCTVK